MKTREFLYEDLRASNGRLRLSSLFWENRFMTKNKSPLYTLADYDKTEDCKSMYLIYMEHDSEYEAAKVLLNSWDHWIALTNSNFFKPYVAKWRIEKDLRDDALARKCLLEEARNGSVSAAKAIIQEQKAVRGRPSKQEKAKLTSAEVEVDAFLASSLKIIK